MLQISNKILFFKISFSYSWNGFSVFFRLDKEHTAGGTGQQRMFILLWHLILSLFFVDIRVRSATVLYFSFGLLILNTVRYHHISLFEYVFFYYFKLP